MSGQMRRSQTPACDRESGKDGKGRVTVRIKLFLWERFATGKHEGVHAKTECDSTDPAETNRQATISVRSA